ncbi:uncharacterized protein LOC128227499 [Mya arenaria]|uniref:uncharacterized protein LOC128227499 n=1 Tax=Mya arenaria TaxID=6604 RepID=UPI0022E4CA1D|nr:uncharacterized protein LOC128227499 [Mya arenaria]
MDTHIEQLLEYILKGSEHEVHKHLPAAKQERDEIKQLVGTQESSQTEAYGKLKVWLEQLEQGKEIFRGKATQTLQVFRDHLKPLLKNIEEQRHYTDTTRASDHDTDNRRSFKASNPIERNREVSEAIQKAEQEKNIIERSKRAGQALRHNNPDIADLSDTNRPTKIAERFSELYDNEWTEAFEKLSKNKITDKKAIGLLLHIVQSTNTFCKEQAETMITSMISSFNQNKETDQEKQMKVKAEEAIPRLKWDFAEEVISMCERLKIPKPSNDGVLIRFAKQATELCWWMNVQDPPVYMCPTDDTRKTDFDPNLYRAYTKTGKHLDFYVWPALKLHENGGVLYKGVAQMTN